MDLPSNKKEYLNEIYYEINLMDYFRNYQFFPFCPSRFNYKILLSTNIIKWAKDGMREIISPIEYNKNENNKEKNIYIDNDRVGLIIERV